MKLLFIFLFFSFSFGLTTHKKCGNMLHHKCHGHIMGCHSIMLKGAKETISLAQAKDAVPGPNCMLKSLWG